MSDLPIKFSKEVSDFIEQTGSKEDNYCWFPFYFKKVGDQLFEMLQFKEANGELKHIVEQSENPNTDGE